MNERQRQQLAEYLSEAGHIDSSYQIPRWKYRVREFLKGTLGADAADQFGALGWGMDEYDELAMKRGHLEGLVAKEEDQLSGQDQGLALRKSSEAARAVPQSRRVFVVHGHDGEAKETVARFLEKLGLDPIILHEQPSQGRTIIEKFELSSSDVAFAVVLLTPDDVGGRASTPSELSLRARQNVILELGYFMGRLGRTRVCALHRGGVELPSDFQGIVYIEFDSGGAWKAKLAQEFVEAKLTINLQALVQ